MSLPGNDRVESLFAEAIGMAAPQRGAFLNCACSDDAKLRKEVESLLKAHDSAQAFLETPAVNIFPDANALAPDDSRLIGCSIGSYRLIRLIGAGGMGRVYESEQGSPRRTVALKLMNSALASSSARRRFEYEAEILARLQHPSIAQIYEAGIHKDRSGDTPYFAMEYVSGGRSILDYASQDQLSRRDRLELFAKVCDAVHHGHQKGIVHRDIKPGNVLVDPNGVPKIIDFGVARTTADYDGDRTRVTRAGEMVGTLQYMSPEQCTMGPGAIDIRSDVYALGLVLFELLTKERPYDLSGKTLVEAARVIQDRRSLRPSTLDRSLRGDLDSIVLMAMEKECDRRYTSAAELAQDIRRFLRREPIEARPPSAAYQFRKLVSRYRLPACFAGLFVLSISVLAIVTTVLSASLARERDRANVEAETARRIAEFQKDMLIAAAPRVAQGREVTVREVLDDAAKIAGESLQDKPEVESAVRDTIGQAYFGLGRYQEAEPQYRTALKIRREVFGENDARTLNTMNNLAVLYVDMGRYQDADPLYRTVLDEQGRLLGAMHPDTIGSAINYTHLLDVLGRRAEGIALLERTLARSRGVLGPDSPETMTAVNSLAVMYAKEGRLEDAAPLFEEASETTRRVNGPDHPNTISSMNNLARLYESTGKLEQAEELIKLVIEKREQILGENHPATLTSRSILARILKRAGRFDEAEAVQYGVWTSRCGQLGVLHPDTLIARRDFAQVLFEQGRYDEAEMHYREALAGFHETLPPGHENTITTAIALGICLRKMERYEESKEQLTEVFTTLNGSRGISHSATQRAVRELVETYDQIGDTRHAEEFRALINEDLASEQR